MFSPFLRFGICELLLIFTFVGYKLEKLQPMLRWLLAVIGYLFYRFPGAIAGFFIGSLLDNLSVRGKTFQSTFNTSNTSAQRVTSADFELHLLSLASLVIKADGNVSQ